MADNAAAIDVVGQALERFLFVAVEPLDQQLASDAFSAWSYREDADDALAEKVRQAIPAGHFSSCALAQPHSRVVVCTCGREQRDEARRALVTLVAAAGQAVKDAEEARAESAKGRPPGFGPGDAGSIPASADFRWEKVQAQRARLRKLEAKWATIKGDLRKTRQRAEAAEREAARLREALSDLYDQVAMAWDDDDIDEDSSYAQHSGVVRARTMFKAREALAAGTEGEAGGAK